MSGIDGDQLTPFAKTFPENRSRLLCGRFGNSKQANQIHLFGFGRVEQEAVYNGFIWQSRKKLNALRSLDFWIFHIKQRLKVILQQEGEHREPEGTGYILQSYNA